MSSNSQPAIVALLGGISDALRDKAVRGLLTVTFTLIGSASIILMYLEGWPWLDALFFSVATISTVGYGDLTPQTAPGKIFVMVYIFLGIGLFVAAAGAVGEYLVRRSKMEDDAGAP